MNEFNYKECLIIFCNSCRYSFELLAELGFRIAYYEEITEIFKFCEKDETISFETSTLEDVEHFQVRHIVTILRALMIAKERIVNINGIDQDQLNTDYEEGANFEWWPFWELETMGSKGELEDDTYNFIYSVLYNVNTFALVLSSGVIKLVEDYDPFKPVDSTQFDHDDQNVGIILNLLDEIRKPFRDFHWDGVDKEEEMDEGG